MDTTHGGETVLITGGSSGIGEATAREFARRGADVVVVGRSEGPLEAVAADLEDDHGVTAVACPADVGDEHAVEGVVETTIEEFGSIDAVVNNAGVIRGMDTDIAAFETEDYRTMMATNVDGTFFTTRAVLPHLVESGGNLVYVGSIAGCYPRTYSPLYAATKWWMRGFALSVEANAGADGVGVTIVHPGQTRTEFGPPDGESWKDKFDRSSASTPGEVAEAIVFAAGQSHSTVSELTLHHRGKLGEL